jgi:peptide/nickel transport system substrate-binding protein
VGAAAIDRGTVQLTLTEPRAGFIEACSVPILPRHVFGVGGGPGLLEHPASYAPVGAGPYRVSHVDLEGVDLRPWDKLPGREQLLDEVQFRFYPDRAAAIRALDAGEVDGLAGASSAELAALSTPERFAIRRGTLNDHETYLLMNHTNPILGEQAVRLAISLAIQRSLLIDGPMQGNAVAAYGPVPASSWAYDARLELDGDRPYALQALEAAGWTGAPVRSRGGRRLILRLATTTDRTQIALAESLSAQLGTVGIQVAVQPTQTQDFFRERLLPRDFDLALLGIWNGTVDPDPWPLWHSSQRDGGLNFGGYGNGEVDALLDLARRDGDPSRRMAALQRFQEIWVQDVPAVALFSPTLHYAVAAQFRGARLGVLAEPSDRFQHLGEWHVRTQRVLAR